MFRNLLTAIILVACFTVQGQNKVAKADGTPVEFEVIMQDQQSNDKRESYRLINNSSDLLKIVGKANMTRSKAYKLPQVDFANYSLVYLNLGEKSTGGYAVSVDEIIDTGSDWMVYYTVKEPGEGELATTAMTSPFVVVKMPRATKAVRFSQVQ